MHMAAHMAKIAYIWLTCKYVTHIAPQKNGMMARLRNRMQKGIIIATHMSKYTKRAATKACVYMCGSGGGGGRYVRCIGPAECESVYI